MSNCITSSAVRKPNGVVLYRGIGLGDGFRKIVAIATLSTDNAKTGDMIQIWILPEDENPLAAVKNGTDDVVCGTCPHRAGNGCYVNVSQAPNQIWKTYKAGKYPEWDGSLSLFAGRKVRFGAYGDPLCMPLSLIRQIAGACDGWTGYTHAWRGNTHYRPFLMASVDNLAEQLEAARLGWRTFRLKTAQQEKLKGELHCPASVEKGQKLTCEDCLACNGNGPDARKANVVIDVHGRKKGRVALTVVGQ